MTEINFEELFARIQKKEEDRKEMIASQIRKGCYNCSQWDDYWGCTKCESDCTC